MSSIDRLKQLHQALVDACNGYEEAAGDAKKPTMIDLFEEMTALHEKHHCEIHGLLLAAGEKPNDEGSFMSTVHRTVIGIRAAVTGLEESSLASFASGEERLLEDYDRTSNETDIEPSTVAVLARQKSQILSKVAVMKGLANQPS